MNRACVSKPGPDARPARGESPNIIIDLGPVFWTTGRTVFGSETPQETINLGPGFRTSSIRDVFFAQNALVIRAFFEKCLSSNKKRPDPTHNAPTG